MIKSIEIWSQVGPSLEKGAVKALAFIAIIGCGYIFSRAAISGLNKLIFQKKIDGTSIRFARSCLRVFFQVSSLLLGLEVIGVDTTSVAAILGAFSFSAGLAMKGLLANAASGLVLVLFGHFKVGDQVELAGTTGEVEEINIFDTVLVSENQRTVIPNSKVVGEKQVISFSKK